MRSRRGDCAGRRTGWRAGLLAALVIPLALLTGASAAASHEAHGDDHECAVCHAGGQTIVLEQQPTIRANPAPARLDPARAVHRVTARRCLRRPARAPPA